MREWIWTRVAHVVAGSLQKSVKCFMSQWPKLHDQRRGASASHGAPVYLPAHTVADCRDCNGVERWHSTRLATIYQWSGLQRQNVYTGLHLSNLLRGSRFWVLTSGPLPQLGTSTWWKVAIAIAIVNERRRRHVMLNTLWCSHLGNRPT